MPVVGAGDVLVRVKATGICGTDLHIESWNEWAQKTLRPPVTVGHEFSGEVVEIGSGVADVAVGDLVSGEGHLVCGRCRNCRAGRRHLCIHTRVIGVHLDGAFAEYVVLPSGNAWVHREPDRSRGRCDLRPVRQCSAHRTGVSDARRGRPGHRRGTDRHHGGNGQQARRRTACGDHRSQRRAAGTGEQAWRDASGEHRPRERLPDAQRELGMREGFDVGLEMSGSSAALRDMITQMTHGGRIAVLGLPSAEISVDVADHRAEDADHQGHLRP